MITIGNEEEDFDYEYKCYRHANDDDLCSSAIINILEVWGPAGPNFWLEAIGRLDFVFRAVQPLKPGNPPLPSIYGNLK